MTNHPQRYYGTNEGHFITCSCYHRKPWLASPRRRDLFLAVFEEVRQRYGFVIVGYAVMPDHVHLLISEPVKGDQTGLFASRPEGRAQAPDCGSAGIIFARLRACVAATLLRFYRVDGA